MAHRSRFHLLLFALALAGLFSCAQGQGRGPNAERTRAIERAEMDRLLLWAVPKDKETEAMRENRFKRIKGDFRDLQSLNNKMMADAWLQDTVNYSSVADMVSKIRGKANDLKDGLSLPQSEEPQKGLKAPAVTTPRQFREELLLLDKIIMRFVTNPVFQANNALDVNLARKASEDLEHVIFLTADLKQNAQKLGKTAH